MFVGKLGYFFEVQFSYLQNGDDNETSYLRRLKKKSIVCIGIPRCQVLKKKKEIKSKGKSEAKISFKGRTTLIINKPQIYFFRYLPFKALVDYIFFSSQVVCF